MKPQTKQSLATLEALTEDLYYSLVGDEPYVTIGWEVEDKGEFSLENLLLDHKALTPVELENFLSQISLTQSQGTIEHYQSLISWLQTNLSDLKIYGYSFPELPEDLFGGDLPMEEDELEPLGIPIILGSSPSGEWIGLAPRQNDRTSSSPNFIISELPSVSEGTAALVEQIKSLTRPLSHQSQCWNLSEIWEVAIANSRHDVLVKLLDDAQFIDIYDLDRFLRLEEENEEEIDDEYRLKEIEVRDFFKQSLKDSRVYNFDFIVSQEHFTIHYALGQTQEGDWVGFVTDSFTF